MRAEEANQFHVLDRPVCHEIAAALFNEGAPAAAGAFLLFDQRIVSDTRPWPWKSLRWTAVPELLRQYGRAALVQFDWSLLVLAVTLVVVLILAALLILLPLRFLRGEGRATSRAAIVVCFASLGLAWFALEMCVFHRAVMFIGDPIVAASVVFGTFLIFSGIGSLSTPADGERRASLRVFVPVIVLIAVSWVLMWLCAPILWHLSSVLRIAVFVLFIAPLAWSVGRPFPWALMRLADNRPRIAWAWGINSFASVLSGPLALILMTQAGSPSALVAAAVLYTTACVSAVRIAGIQNAM